MRVFKNRTDAGRQLTPLLKHYQGANPIVYALPRGGVVVAAEIAQFLHAPLDLLFAHKIGNPYHPEYAVAAVSESGHLIESAHELLDKRWLEGQKQIQREEIKRKRSLYLKNRPDHPVEGKIAIIVDDGIATGLTMRAAILELKGRRPQQIVVAIPVSPKSTAELLRKSVDEVVGVEIDDEDFLGSVGAYYQDFRQVEDEEVIALLNQMR